MSGGGKGGGSQTIPTEGTRLSEPISFWHSAVGTYPGNNLTWWIFKRPIAVGNDQAPKYFLEVFDPGMRNQLQMVNARASSGHYIYDAFRLDRGTAAGIPGLTSETSNGAMPSVVSFFAGRAWYGGTNSTKYSSRIYFSQILERTSQVGDCFQQQDPTAETAPELLSSDGGVIVIPEMQQLIRLFPIGHTLLAMASNGVWGISGSQGLGFSASDYSVSRLTDTPVLSASSVVDVDGVPIWWNRSGIYMVKQSGAMNFAVESLTDKTIRQFFLDIPDDAKKWAKGAYNKQSKIVQWVYSSTSPATTADVNKYDRILNLNLLTGAFYPWTLGDSRVDIIGIFAVEGDVAIQTLEDVYIGTDQVLISTDPVVMPVTSYTAVDSQFKYIVNVHDDIVSYT